MLGNEGVQVAICFSGLGRPLTFDAAAGIRSRSLQLCSSRALAACRCGGARSSRAPLSGSAQQALVVFAASALQRCRLRKPGRRKHRAVQRCAQSSAVTARPSGAAAAYQVIPNQGCEFGGVVEGFDVRAAIGNPELVQQLRADMARYRLLVFRGQTELTGEDHIALSECLGCLDHGLHKAHARAPDPRLLRVSNDQEQGFVQVGTSGWHVDGVMLQAPFHVQTMHFVSSIPGGDTLFLGFREFLESLGSEDLDRLRKLWFVSGVGKDIPAGDGQLSVVPLVYRHPFTGEDSMSFHLGDEYCLGWFQETPAVSGFDTLLGSLFQGKPPPSPEMMAAQKVLKELLPSSERGEDSPDFSVLPPRPTQEMLSDLIENMSAADRQRAVCRQQWQTGDFALIDNMALAHLAEAGTQAPAFGPRGAGLRIFHRTTMVDRSAPGIESSLRGAKAVLLVASASSSSSGEAPEEPEERPLFHQLVGLGSKAEQGTEAERAASPPSGSAGWLVKRMVAAGEKPPEETETSSSSFPSGSRAGAVADDRSTILLTNALVTAASLVERRGKGRKSSSSAASDDGLDMDVIPASSTLPASSTQRSAPDQTSVPKVAKGITERLRQKAEAKRRNSDQ